MQEDKYIEGLQIRAHVRWVEEGERSTQYFARLISAKRACKSMTGVLLEDRNNCYRNYSYGSKSKAVLLTAV